MAVWALLAAGVTRFLPAPIGEPAAAGNENAGPGAWRHRGARPSYLISVGLGVGEGGLVAALPALLVALGRQPGAAGLLAAVLAAASAVGGLALSRLQARLPGTPTIQSACALILMSAVLLITALGPNVGFVVVGLVGGGLFIAPVNALRARALEQALPSRMRSEGYSIQYGANGLGVAAGSGLIAALVNMSPRIAIASALAVGAAAGVVAALLHRGGGGGVPRGDRNLV